jgi:hypothetical protein
VAAQPQLQLQLQLPQLPQLHLLGLKRIATKSALAENCDVGELSLAETKENQNPLAGRSVLNFRNLSFAETANTKKAKKTQKRLAGMIVRQTSTFRVTFNLSLRNAQIGHVGGATGCTGIVQMSTVRARSVMLRHLKIPARGAPPIADNEQCAISTFQGTITDEASIATSVRWV